MAVPPFAPGTGRLGLAAAGGIEDSAEALRWDLAEAGDEKARPELVAAYADNQLETYEWPRAVDVRLPLESRLAGDAGFTGRGIATRRPHDPLVGKSGSATPRALGRRTGSRSRI